jgi:hypothetical protein
VSAATGTAILDGEQLLDVAQLQAQGLRSADEVEAVDVGLVVLPIPRMSACGFCEQAFLLVVPDRVRRDVCPLCQFRDLRYTLRRLDLGVNSKVKCMFSLSSRIPGSRWVAKMSEVKPAGAIVPELMREAR